MDVPGPSTTSQHLDDLSERGARGGSPAGRGTKAEGGGTPTPESGGHQFADPGLVLSAITGRNEAAPLGTWPTFGTQAEVDLAASLVPEGRSHSLFERWSLEVAPGSVRVRVRQGNPTEPRPTLGRRGTVTMWSAGSRSRMVKKLATIDWTEVIDAGPDRRAALVTLTYPGEWLGVCPTAKRVKQHLAAFRRAHERSWGTAPAVWKLEFQRRGAPHFHLYVPVPIGQVSWRQGRGRGSHTVEGTYREWLSKTWASIVSAEGEERVRHELAGTGVDFAEASKMRDPKRIAIYFVGHNAKMTGSKAHQHQPPAEWLGEGTGRWWGLWSLHPVTAEKNISRETAVEVRRLLRGYIAAQARVREVQVWRKQTRPMAPGQHGPPSPPRLRKRKVRRRVRVKALTGGLGATVVVNNGPRVTEALAVWLQRQVVETREVGNASRSR